MAGPYRESEAPPINCPRCGRAMPPGDIAACIAGCGVWVNAAIAPEVFEPRELEPSRITTWYRERVPCPHCSEPMILRGNDMALFLGCAEHGSWVDDETVGQTGLGRATVAPRVRAARAAAKALESELIQAELATRAKLVAAERSRHEVVAAARRAAEERAEVQRQSVRRRVEMRRPYVELVQALLEHNSVVPLAEHLMELDQRMQDLVKRITALEAAARR